MKRQSKTSPLLPQSTNTAHAGDFTDSSDMVPRLVAFEITIFRGGETGNPVRASWRGADGLPHGAEGHLSITRQELLGVAHDQAAYGRLLGEALFHGELRQEFMRALDQSSGHLRILLAVEDPTLRQLHWERLCAPLDGQWSHLALTQRLPFSHYLPSFADRSFPPFGRYDLRALILVASPDGLSRFNLQPFNIADAVNRVRKALNHYGISTTLLADAPDASGPPTLASLCTQLTAGSFPLMHIICHGRVVPHESRGDDTQAGETILYLAHDDDPRQAHPVPATAFIDQLRMLRGIYGLPQCIFLSSCETASPQAENGLDNLAHRLVRDLGVPAVIAMTGKVSVATANDLAEQFYDRLHAHGEVDLALVEATARLSTRADILIPALYSRLGERSLFTDGLTRPPTSGEIAHGLGRLNEVIPQRAPVLITELGELERKLQETLASPEEDLSPTARSERTAVLHELDVLCLETLDLSFSAVAMGAPLATYDNRCPFPGLAAFAPENRDFFFGRSTLIQRLMMRLTEYPFLAVLGPSGSGKSSLILAGLVPLLQKRQPDRLFVTFKPGASPLDHLTEALDQVANQPALVVVDQFEELFTLCADDRQRHAFLDQLLGFTHHLVVITMRADFWGECARYPQLGSAMQANQELVGPMTPNELRLAIGQQAERVGLRFEAMLIDQLFDDLIAEPGAMPLLQHALRELWQRRRGRWLRAVEYLAIGRIQGAIADTAEAIYTELFPADRQRLRDILLRLTRPDPDAAGEAARDMRRRVSLAELVPAGENDAVTRQLVSRLASARLLVTGNDAVEVAHEALIRVWPRLRQWLDDDRAALRVREQLRQAAYAWERNQRDESGLIHRGLQLQQAEALVDQSRFVLNHQEHVYLAACITLREREQEQAIAAQRHELEHAHELAEAERQKAAIQTQAAQRLRQRAAYLFGALAVALVGLAAAILFGLEARRNAAEARNRALIASAQAALAQHNPDLALTLALDAVAAPLPEAHRVLIEAVTTSATRLRLEGHTAPVRSVTVSPNGQIALSASADGTLRRWDVASGKEVGHLIGHAGPVTSVAISPDGKIVISGSEDGTLRRWDVTSGQSEILGDHSGSIYSVAISPDGKTALSGGEHGEVRLWDLARGQEFQRLDGHRGTVYSVTFSPDGQNALSGDQEGEVRLWDLASGRLVRRLTGHTGAILSVAFSPDGEQIVSGGGDNTVRLWSATGELIRSFIGHTGQVRSVAFSPDGGTILSGSFDQTIRLWEVATGHELRQLTGHSGPVWSVAFGPDGVTILSASEDTTLRVWDLRNWQELRRFIGPTNQVASVALSPDGSHATAGSDDATLCLWATASGEQIACLPQTDAVLSVAFSPNGQQILFGLRNGTLGLWDGAVSHAPLMIYQHHDAIRGVAISPNGQFALFGAEDGMFCLVHIADSQQRQCHRGHQAVIFGVAISPDGQRILTASQDRTLRLWDAATMQELRVFRGHTGAVWSVAFSPDGRSALSGSEDETLRLWDVASGDVVHIFVGHQGEVRSVRLSPDGQMALSGSGDSTIRLWDVASGQELRRLEGHQSAVNAVAFGPDGHTALSGGADVSVRQWRIDSLAEVIAWVRANRYLSAPSPGTDEP